MVQIKNSLQNNMWILPPICPHKRVFLGFEIVKTLELLDAEPPDPCQGVWSLWWTVHGMRIYCEITSNHSWSNFNSTSRMTRNMLRHYLKMHESEDMIKTEATQTWSECVNFTLRNRFSLTFKVLKLMSFWGSAWEGVLNFHFVIGVRPEGLKMGA